MNPCTIELATGEEVLVDAEDFERVSQHKWQIHPKGYAKGRLQYMHRFIMNAPKNMQIDHINDNKLDNRKSNLRLCTNAQNQMSKGLQSNNTSGYRGVYWDKKHNRWGSIIKFNQKQIRLGFYDDVKEAARVYDSKAKELFKDFARLNMEGGVI